MFLNLQGGVMLLVAFVLLVVKLFAFVSSLRFETEAYRAAGKLTKPTWAMILGGSVALQLLTLAGLGLSLVNLVLTIAALVYLADVRPALAGLRRR
ncbi:DUF2516 family protein [Nocardioides insulae]|uniref:DUF2516 family protein n=1 Tax=Nocardioides insulae TaxID=394734 RepID=UPI00056B38BE|nr:DUF2516 family protein [Nocardioides insulae]